MNALLFEAKQVASNARRQTYNCEVRVTLSQLFIHLNPKASQLVHNINIFHCPGDIQLVQLRKISGVINLQSLLAARSSARLVPQIHCSPFGQHELLQGGGP